MPEDYFENHHISSQTPSDTHYQTPPVPSRRSSSRGSRATLSSFTPGTPPPLPTNSKYTPEQPRDDGVTSPGAADAFTPNLHASLVSEILALRREVESKNTVIERLEVDLDSARTENEVLQDNTIRQNRETKSIKRQLQTLEDSTLQALEDVYKERDSANEAAVDFKDRLEATQKKLRVQEERSSNALSSLEQDRAHWVSEKQLLERRALVAEGRLKEVVQEFAAREAALQDLAEARSRELEETVDHVPSVPVSPTKSIRAHRRGKASVSSIGSEKKGLTNGLVSLEDELNMEQDDDVEFSDDDLIDHETKLRNIRQSRLSGIQDEKAKKLLGILPDDPPAQAPDWFVEASKDSKAAVDDGETVAAEPTLAASPKIEDTPIVPPVVHTTPPPVPLYIDAGVQYTPPASPKSSPQISPADSPSVSPEPQPLPGFQPLREINGQPAEILANQRRKRDPLSPEVSSHSRAKSDPLPERRPGDGADSPQERPGSPTSVKSFHTADGIEAAELPQRLPMVSASTQTEPPEQPVVPIPPPPTRAPPPIPFQVPSIVISPSEKRPDSPQETVLPPGTKNVGTQTAVDGKVATVSVGVQTDVIRVDRRLIKLPPHLLPSAILEPLPSKKSPTQPSFNRDSFEKAGSDPRRDSVPSASGLPSLAEDADEESGSENVVRLRQDSMDEGSWSRLRKNMISTGKYSSFMDKDLADGLDDTDLSEDDYTHHLPMTRAGRSMQRVNRALFDPPTPVPEDEKMVSRPHTRPRGWSMDKARVRDSRKANARGGAYAKASSSTQTRPWSPSTASNASSSNWSKKTGPPPPFAIPERSSSVGVSKGRSDAASAITSRTSMSSPTRRSAKSAKRVPPPLRKARSTANISEKKSVPTTPLSVASFASDETRPPLPALNAHHFPPRTSSARPSTSGHSHIYQTITPTGNASVGTSVQHTVVDAIAATMVGEWMWKYTRKRKSFGVADYGQDAGKTGEARHKRWVWLSPYERTVMWSNKQPQSNSALMGKGGRKLAIQSVLDVSDEASPPKTADAKNTWNRSILILTPARALKFTAISRERHYLWLTALSFLAHHTSHGRLDLSFLPPAPAVQEAQPANHVRNDSEAAACNPRQISRPWYRAKEKITRSRESSGFVTPYVADGASRPDSQNQQAYPLHRTVTDQSNISETAFPPAVPRIPAHNRKRSASGPSSMRPSATTSMRSLHTAITGGSSTNPYASAAGSASHSARNSKPNSSHANSSNSRVPLPPPLRGNPTVSGGNSVRNNTSYMNSPMLVEETEDEDEGESFRSARYPSAEESMPKPKSNGLTLDMKRQIETGATADATKALNRRVGELNGQHREPKSPTLTNRSSRFSEASAEFGGNMMFFDAVGGGPGAPPLPNGTSSQPEVPESQQPNVAIGAPPPPRNSSYSTSGGPNGSAAPSIAPSSSTIRPYGSISTVKGGNIGINGSMGVSAVHSGSRHGAGDGSQDTIDSVAPPNIPTRRSRTQSATTKKTTSRSSSKTNATVEKKALRKSKKKGKGMVSESENEGEAPPEEMERQIEDFGEY